MISLSLRQRLLLLTLLPAALLAVLTAAYFTYAGHQALDRELRERGLATVRYLAPVAEYGVLAGQLEGLQGPLQAAVQQSGVKAALVVGRNGRILAVSGRVSLSSDVLREPLSAPALVAEGEHWLGFGAPIVRSVADIGDLFSQSTATERKPEPLGQVFIELDTKAVKEAQLALLQRGLLILLVGLALAAIVARTIAEQVAHPILRLVAAVRAMSGGQYDVRVPANSQGEFGELERGFNEMAANIDTSHAGLQERIELATADLVYQARHDSLTDLINRREFESRLIQAGEAAKAGGVESAVLFIDLDRFKNVNDSVGHLAGDEVLRQLSRQLTSRLREKDTLARIGGDEFAVLLPATSMKDAAGVAEELCRLVERYRLPWDGQIFSVGASIGVVSVNSEFYSVTDVLQAGDAACYEAKHKGRNRVEVHVRRADQITTGNDGNQVRERIERALQADSMLWEAIPIQHISGPDNGLLLADLRAVLNDGSEHPLQGAVLDELAGRYGFATAIDHCGIAAAVKALKQSHYAPNPPVLMLSLSTASLCDRATGKRLVAAFADSLLQPASLCIVLGEEAVIRNMAEAEYLTRCLRESGFSIALGDFGGWMTSFSHLHVVRPQYLRINHNLTRDLAYGRSAGALARAVQEVATDLGIATIAERVGEAETLAALKALGVTYAYGEMLGRPMPLGDWIAQKVVGRR